MLCKKNLQLSTYKTAMVLNEDKTCLKDQDTAMQIDKWGLLNSSLPANFVSSLAG